jgi:DNA-binding response OmpR family regulator
MVDDDEEMCEELSEILGDEGYSVRTAFDGLTGSMLVDEDDYDVILLDMKMPGLEGYDVLRKIKTLKPATRVIVLTGRPMSRKSRIEEGVLISDDDDTKAEILRLADCVMNKPFDVEKVIGKIAEFAR